MIYLDNAATTKPYENVVETVRQVMEGDYANPSALHDGGLSAERRVKAARELLAALFVARGKDRLVFTSGGTESSNMALLCGARSRRRQGDRIITTPIEHAATLETCKFLESEGFRVSFLALGPDGRVEPDSLEALLGDDVALISSMDVNNETGAVQPLGELLAIRRDFEKRTGKRVLFHVDAAQSFCKLPLHEADLTSASAHKLHGPKGAGALLIREGASLKPLIHGGGQEGGLRSGTENVPAIAGFAEAARTASSRQAENLRHVAALKEALLEGLMAEIKDVRLNGPPPSSGHASPYILNLSFPGARGEVLVHALEERGVQASTGAACSSRKKKHSHVLKAMGLSDVEAESAIRFSLSELNTMEEMELAVAAVKESVGRLRGLGGFKGRGS